MSKQKNPNIGQCPCPICTSPAAVRKASKGQQHLYLVCAKCGMITPNMQHGQDYILENAIIWGSQPPPADAEAWIKEEWPWPRAVAATNTPEPAPEPAPESAATPPEPTPEPAPEKPRKRSLLGGLSDFLDDAL